MLVLSRKQDEWIRIGHDVRILVTSIHGEKVRLGIEAPRNVPVHRDEIYQAIYGGQAERTETATTHREASDDLVREAVSS